MPPEDSEFKPGNKLGEKTRVLTFDRVAKALRDAHGSVAEAARLLKRRYGKGGNQSVRDCIKKWPELEKIREQAFDVALDVLSHNVVDSALKGDTRDRQFVLQYRHPEFRKKQEITGLDGGPLQLAAISSRSPVDILLEGCDPTALPRKEQIELARFCEQIEGFQGDFTQLVPTDLLRFQTLLGKAKGLRPPDALPAPEPETPEDPDAES